MRDGGATAVVTDDSQFMRTIVASMLERNGFEVVARAADGEAAVEAVAEHRPDVVTMDVEMPVMDGLAATERIMETVPTPVVMLSALTEEGADVTMEALDRGAVDFFPKPGGSVTTALQSHEAELVERVRAAASADPEAAAAASGPTGTGTVEADAGHEYVENPVLVVGASTGGPPVVERTLAGLPLEADLRILVVQHMSEGFTESFAERLDRATAYEVREASDGERIGGGEAVVAPGGRHLEVAGHARGRLRLALTEAPREHGVRPAVDVTLRSVAERVGSDTDVVAVVMTGMGRDGAEGVRRLRAAGGRSIAQDEATSTVYGMPAAAVETGCVDRVLPGDRLADGIVNSITREVGPRVGNDGRRPRNTGA